MASVDILQRAQWPTRSIYYKLTIFICFYKAFHDRLPVTLIDLIFKKQATNYSTRNRDSLIVPRFNTHYMKDSVAIRGSILWNAVTKNCSALTRNVPYRDLRLKLKSLVNFNEFSFKQHAKPRSPWGVGASCMLSKALVRVLVWPSSVIGKACSEESASIILPIGLVGARGSFSKTVPQSVELAVVSHVPT